MVAWIAKRWCTTFHRVITLPVERQYTCLTCLRKYPVEW